jgi:hypothetical protein
MKLRSRAGLKAFRLRPFAVCVKLPIGESYFSSLSACLCLPAVEVGTNKSATRGTQAFITVFYDQPPATAGGSDLSAHSFFNRKIVDIAPSRR